LDLPTAARRRIIPVIFRLDNGTPTTDTVSGKPCITIHYTPQVERLNGTFDPQLMVQIFAMIDTGATYNVVDDTVCAASPILRHVPAQGFLSAGVAAVRRGTLMFTDSDDLIIPCQDEFCSAPIVGEAYKAIIGRSFLKVCKLVYDGPSQDYKLYFDF
jgi:hypothetical protein